MPIRAAQASSSAICLPKSCSPTPIGLLKKQASRQERIEPVGERLVAVEDDDLNQLEPAIPNEAPGLTKGSGYGSNKVTIVFDIEHLRTPFPDGREARETPTTRAAGGTNKKVTWKRSTRPGLPSEATASGDQSHCREGSERRLSAEQAYVAHESLEQDSGMGHEQRPHDRRAPFVAEEVRLEVNGLAVRGGLRVLRSRLHPRRRRRYRRAG